MKKTKKIASLVLSAAVAVSSMAIPAAAAETEVPSTGKVTFLGGSWGGTYTAWEEPMAKAMGWNISHVSSDNMKRHMIELSAVEATNPDMVVINTNVMANEDAEVEFLENILQTLLTFDKTPYVALVGNTSSDNRVDAVKQLAEIYDVDYLCLADKGSDQTQGEYLASAVTYNKIDVPESSEKLSAYAHPVNTVNVYSGTLADGESAVFDVYGSYIIVNGTGASFKMTSNGSTIMSRTLPGWLLLPSYRLGYGKKQIVLTAVGGTATISGIYTDAQPKTNNVYYGFEDNDMTLFEANSANDSTYEWIPEGAGSSNGAVAVTKVGTDGNLSVRHRFEVGKKYKISANIKPVSSAASEPAFNAYLMRNRYVDDTAENNISANTGWNSLSLGTLTMNEWNSVSTEIEVPETVSIGSGNTAPAADYGHLAVRMSDGAAGGKYYIDDLVIEEVTASSGSGILTEIDTDFEDYSYGELYRVGNDTTHQLVQDTDGNVVLQMTTSEASTVQNDNFYFTPNRYYEVSYKVKGVSDNSIGKYIKPIVTHTADMALDSNGNAAKVKVGNNYNYLNSAEITNEWQTVTQLFGFSYKAVSDDMGKSSFNFKLFNSDTNDHNYRVTDPITIQMDDIKITPCDIIYNGDFDGTDMDVFRFGEIVTGTDKNGQQSNMYKCGSSDSMVWPSLMTGKKYRLSFDIKGENISETAPTFKPIVSGDSGGKIEAANDYLNLSEITLSNDWQSYSTEFTWSPASGLQKFPQMHLRPSNLSGYYYLDNFKIEEIQTEGISDLAAADMLAGERSDVTFNEYGTTGTKVYKIYSGDAIYAAGETDGSVIAFNNYASAGTKLFIDVAYYNADGELVDTYTAELGTVASAVVFSAATSFTTDAADFIDGKIEGKLAVQNDGTARTITLAVVIYECDENGNITGIYSVDTQECTLKAYENTEFTLASSAVLDWATDYSAKVFAWDSLEGLKPLANASALSYFD